MRSELHPKHFPDIILLLGTDASGKDFVANVLEQMIREAGGEVEKRQRFLSGRVTTATSSEGKGIFDTLQEKAFLLILARLGPLLPFLLGLVIRWDLRRLRTPAAAKLVVVGHSAVRALAFHLGHRVRSAAEIRLPAFLVATLTRMREQAGLHVIVLDVEDRVRKKRIAARLEKGSEDTLDRYMHSDSERSECIEDCLVHLAVNYLNAGLIENNDLAEAELRERILSGFPRQL